MLPGRHAAFFLSIFKVEVEEYKELSLVINFSRVKLTQIVSETTLLMFFLDSAVHAHIIGFVYK